MLLKHYWKGNSMAKEKEAKNLDDIDNLSKISKIDLRGEDKNL